MVPPHIDIQSSLKINNPPKATKTVFGELVENLNYVRVMC
jgi:hypothetical protein